MLYSCAYMAAVNIKGLSTLYSVW